MQYWLGPIIQSLSPKIIQQQITRRASLNAAILIENVFQKGTSVTMFAAKALVGYQNKKSGI
jgi:hypothetical protein